MQYDKPTIQDGVAIDNILVHITYPQVFEMN